MMRLLPLALLLGACAVTQQPPAIGAGAICRADGLGDLSGQPATAELGAQALERSGGRTVRWIQPNTAVTMDYRQDRLDIYLDENNAVSKISCG